VLGLGMLPNERPPGTLQNDEGDAAYSQGLLVADAPVGRERHPNPCGITQRLGLLPHAAAS